MHDVLASGLAIDTPDWVDDAIPPVSDRARFYAELRVGLDGAFKLEARQARARTIRRLSWCAIAFLVGVAVAARLVVFW